VIGLDGEIIQCIPCAEMSYASNDRNTDSIAIECCHPDETGAFTEETYASCVRLTAWLCKAFHVPPEQVIRHHDITGKDCPRYYVQHEEDWKKLKADVLDRYHEIGGIGG
jgi:N-acetylmuramoyl-L-alanine amidase CwlA